MVEERGNDLKLREYTFRTLNSYKQRDHEEYHYRMLSVCYLQVTLFFVKKKTSLYNVLVVQLIFQPR